MRSLALLTLLAALAVFAFVQDRVTAAGARSYVEQQRARIEAGQPPIRVDEVMGPAIRTSVTLGGAAAAGVVLAGLLAALPLRRAAKRVP